MADELDDAIKISDKTLMAPLVMAKNLEEVYKVSLLISKDRGVVNVINSATTSTKKLKDETAVLTKQTQQLVGVQKAMADAVQADSKAYTQEVNVLKQLNNATKDTLSNTDKEIKGLKEKRASLDANRVAYAGYRTEAERNTKEAKTLQKTIQAQAAELEKLVGKTDKNTKASTDYTSVLSSMKAELKAAQGEMAHIAETLGVESEEFKEAAQRAGALSDEMGDLREATKAVSGEPIERLGGSFDLLKGKLSSLDFKGATGALKGITSATKDLNFKTAIQGAGGFGKAMGGLGKALLANPIFLLVAAIIGIGLAVNALKDKVWFLSKAFDAMGEALDWIVQQAKDFSDSLGLTTFAIDDMTEATVKGAAKQREAWEQMFDDQIKLAGAAGKATTDAEKQKQEAILATTNIAIQAYKNQKQFGSKLTEDQQKDLAELIKLNHDASIELQAIKLREQNELDKIAKDAAKEREKRRLEEEGDAFKLSQFLIQNQIEAQEEILNNEKNSYDKRMSAADELVALRKQQALSQYEEALAAENLTNSGLLLAQAEYQQARLDIEKTAKKEIDKVNADDSANRTKAMEEALQKNITAIQAQAQANQNAITAELDAFKQGLIDKGVASDEINQMLLDKQKSMIDDQIQVEIDAQKKILDLENLTAEERLAVEQKLFDLKSDLTDAYYNQLEEKDATALEKANEFIDKWKGSYQAFADGVGAIFDGMSEKRLAQIDEESVRLKEEQDKLLADFEGNAKAQASIKEQFAKKEEQLEARRRKEVRKQAIVDKAIAFSMGGIKLAQAIIAMLSVGPAGFALAAVTAAIGAVQLAAIASKPIPAAEKGIKGHKGGLILAGERDHELVEMPGGKLAITDNKPTLYDLPAGTNIYAHNDRRTVDALATRNLPLVGRDRQPIRSERSQELKMLGDIHKVIKNKPVANINGYVSGYSVGYSRTNYINSMRNG